MKILIVDDETLARERMKRLLLPFSDCEICGEASDGIMALEKIDLFDPDVIFLDIEMPELDGLGVAEAVQAKIHASGEGQRQCKSPFIVFTTAYSEFAIQAFELSALDYLVKPVAEARLTKAIEKLRQTHSRRANDYGQLLSMLGTLKAASGPIPRKFAVRCGSKFVVFDPATISAIVARDHYAAIILDQREILCDDSIENLIARLDSSFFIRVHRGAAINIAFLRELEREGDRKYVAVLSDQQKTKIPIARERLGELKERLGIS